ncbi:MAG TPA: cupin domain-containing protein [Actinomycetes bacterium]
MVHRRRLHRRHRPGQGAIPGAGERRRFTPSARTAWHAHAVGQTLYVTEGKGLVQSRGGPVEEIGAGDVITTPPATSDPRRTGASTSPTTSTTTADPHSSPQARGGVGMASSVPTGALG